MNFKKEKEFIDLAELGKRDERIKKRLEGFKEKEEDLKKLAEFYKEMGKEIVFIDYYINDDCKSSVMLTNINSFFQKK